MNKKFIGFLLSIFFVLVVLVGVKRNANAQEENPVMPPVDQIIVKYKDDSSLQQAVQAQAGSQMQRLNTAAGVTIEYFRPMSGEAHVLRLEGPISVDQALAITARLEALPEVEYAEPDYIAYPLEVDVNPNDPRYYEQWHYFAPPPTTANYGVNAPAAWDITKGVNNINIAVLDTGITDHTDLAGRWIGGYDLISNSYYANDGGGRDADPHDPGDWSTAGDSCGARNSTWHGTHVAGTIGAASNNSKGVAGINWVSKIVPVRVLGRCGNTISDIADGIRWAAGLTIPGVPVNLNPARVINLSLGGYTSTGCAATYQNAINAAYGTGSVIVVSAGNENIDSSYYQPGNCANVITVAATNRYGNKANYSNYGATVEISAPGGDSAGGVLSTSNTGTTVPVSDDYRSMLGTSMAAPHVSGVVSLMFSLNPALTPSQVQSILQSTATTISCTQCGSGIVNAAAALQAVPDATPGVPVLSAIINPYGEDNYTVNWNDVLNADSYRLQEDDNISFSSPKTVSNILISQYLVSGQQPGTWYYRVQSINTDGASDWSNTVKTIVKPDQSVMNAFTNPANADSYLVSWSGVAPADGYILLEANNASLSNAKIKYKGMDTSYLVTGQAGGTWYYSVRAYIDDIYGDLSANTASTMVTPSTLAAPTLASIDNTDQDGDFTAIWLTVSGASSYILEESDNPYFVDPVVVYNGPLTEKQIVKRTGGSWSYRVRAVSNTDNSPWSESVFTTVRSFVFLPVLIKNVDITTTFNSVADTCVLQGYPSENFGDYNSMLAGYDDDADPDGKIVRSMVKFDISDIPSGTFINQATLYLYLNGSYDFPDKSRMITIYRAGSIWSEMETTWNSQPVIQEAYGVTSVTHGQWEWYAFNVKDLISGWVNGTWPNYGLVIRGPEHSGDDSSWKSFYTRESNFAPYIEVSYNTFSVQETQPMIVNTTLEQPDFLDLFSPQTEEGKQVQSVTQLE